MRIKTDSNINEVYTILSESKPQLAAQEPKTSAAWNKVLREAKGKGTSMFYEYEINGNQMVHFRQTAGYDEYFVHLIVVPFAKDKYQYLHWQSSKVDVFKYTSHFFERYKERMNVKGNMKQAVKRYFKNAKSMVCVYWKNDRFVYVMDDGLVLGVADQQLGMKVGCTFVSYNLLKNSQRTSFDKIQAVVEDMRNVHMDLVGYGVSNKDSAEVIDNKFGDIREAAEEIYSWYFEEGDLRIR